MTALHLVRTAASTAVPVFFDDALATPPKRADRLTFTERYATVERYLSPVLRKAPLITPLSVAFFGGLMDHRKLTLGKRLFAQLLPKDSGGEGGAPRRWRRGGPRSPIAPETGRP